MLSYWTTGFCGIFPDDADDFAVAITDTIPITDPYGDFLTDPNTNPFDIKPKNVTQEVEYDPETNQYIITEKIGEEYFSAPTYMTFEEYVAWKQKNEEREYFQQLAGVKSGYKSKSGIVDPVEKIDIKDNLVDRLFGGTEVDLQPQGNIDLTIGWDYQKIDNPTLLPSQRTNGGLDFGMDIKMNVDGQIGEKMKIGFNYDTQATFDFDRKIKLAYDNQEFSEDDIVKTIEAGNVSLPLRGSLIQGAQSLFGLKTELQFGRLRLTGIASQQKSQNQNVAVQNGSSESEFFIRPDEYDENRHFFISHYHRATYERSLNNLPYINSSFKINNLQVWVSDNRPDYQNNSAIICALSDLAEPADSLFTQDLDGSMTQIEVNPVDPIFLSSVLDENGERLRLPDNRVNNMYVELGLATNQNARRKDVIASELKGSPFFMEDTRDFQVVRARLLNASEYTFNPDLGFISLNVRLQPNQVLSVAYDYYYIENCDEVYTVGETIEESISQTTIGQDGEEEVEPEKVRFTKMLKSSNQRTDLPSWDLMMKNVYPLNTSSLAEGDFEFDIFYENDAEGTLTKFIPLDGLSDVPLLDFFKLDRLNRFGDPQQDGVFDFVPGVTVIERNGSIIFPVLEPFGESIEQLFRDKGVEESVIQDTLDFFEYKELYDTTVVIARQEFLHKNKFIMRGKVKGGASSEISLGAWNIPQGSVRVTAGGNTLIEGVDYEIDYGIGRLRILNPAYVQSSVPINVSFEDNSVFSLQQKTMLGLRADYEVSDKLVLGGTYLRLFERPFTQKVNFGDDPINNRIFGLDMNYSSESDAITRIVDKLPFYSTKEPSSINFMAEVAAIKPGHSKAINLEGEDADKGGVVSIDDFEGAISGFLLGSQGINVWSIASTPEAYPGGQSTGLDNGANRALLNWYVVDRNTRNQEDEADSYTRLIRQQDLFNRDLPVGTLQDLFTFDLNYYPSERGPYNFDLPETGYPGVSAGLTELDDKIQLKEPETRWAGIMRFFNNNDFQAVNYQAIEFWVLDPYIDSRDKDHADNETGNLVFHLGNVSEDILNDNQQFFENTIPVNPNATIPIISTDWAEVPLVTPTNNAFDNNESDKQDLGLDGLDNSGEQVKFRSWLDAIAAENWFDNDINMDPANDDFLNFLDPSFNNTATLFDRYKRFNNLQGNTPSRNNPNDPNIRNQSGNPRPDDEDLNQNKSLDEGESYYEYKVPFNRNPDGSLDTTDTQVQKYYTDQRTVINPATNDAETWYRFRVPLNQSDSIVGDIQGFRSIQFMRMIMQGFETNKTFRLAEFELVRNQWRRQQPQCKLPGIDGEKTDFGFSIQDIGIEENQNKQPFGYISPTGIKQEQLFSTFSNVLQDEKSLAMNFEEFSDSDCELTMSKLTQIDLRVFDNMQMFVHAEDILSPDNPMPDGAVTCFIRFGKDFVNNYYEYEIPLVISKDGVGENANEVVWRPENMFDFPMDVFTELKKDRNFRNALFTERDSLFFNQIPNIENDPTKENQKVTIKGNPNLADIKGFMIGLRLNDDENLPPVPPGGYSGQVWVNELRCSGLLERGGYAGLARMDIQLADLGSFAASGSYSSIGWGALDQKVDNRQKEQKIDYDFGTNLEFGKFLPSKWNISVPFYAQYSKSISKPEFDPYDKDLTVVEKIDAETTPEGVAAVKDRSKEETTIRTINFTNVRKNRSSGKAGRGNTKRGNSKSKAGNKKKASGPKPWDIENVSASYSYNEIERKDFLIKSDVTKDYKVGLYYDYSKRANFIQPFKKLKPKFLKFAKEFNFNLIPQSFSFGSEINRFTNVREYREPEEFDFVFNDQRFNWERVYDLKWDLAKSLKMSLSATHNAIIDEYRQVGIKTDATQRTWVDERQNVIGEGSEVSDVEVKEYWQNNLRDFGRAKDYTQQFRLSYNVPLKYIPGLDWITVKAQYDSQYDWNAGGLITIGDNQDNLGNIIQNTQDRSVNAGFSFEKLYEKIGYFKRLEGKNTKKRTQRTSRTRNKKELTKDGGDAKKAAKADKEPRAASFPEKLLLRPLLSLRKADINYKESFSTLIPGFMENDIKYLGTTSGFAAPGLDFAFGLQPDLDIANTNNWLVSARDKGWLNPSKAFNQQLLQSSRQNFDAKVKLEPWKDVKVDVNFKKNFTNDNTQYFANKGVYNDNTLAITDPVNVAGYDFQQFGYNEFGSFEVTYFSLNTLFNDSDAELNAMFNTFENNRTTISRNLDPTNNNPHETDGQSGYEEGYGKLSTDVVIPAFLAAYTGQDINTYDVTENLAEIVSSRTYIPKPNWRLSYNGLSKLSMFKDVIQSFTLEHGYSNTLKVARFFNDPNYDPTLGTTDQETQLTNGNYFSRLETSNVFITERFDPIIGLSLKTKSDANFDFKWAKSRTLDLQVVSAALLETRKTEFVLGFGYAIQNVNIGFLTGDKKGKRNGRKKGEEEEEEEKDARDRAGRGNGGVTDNRERELRFNLDFKFSDDVTLRNGIDDGQGFEPTRGTKTINISPFIDYDVSKDFTLRMFVDYGKRTPRISTGFPITTVRGGFTMRFNLN